MSTKARLAWLALGAVLAAGSAHSQTPLGTAFTYQGRLVDGTAPANGAYDFQLMLFAAASGGTQVGPTLTLDDVTVVEGLFTTSADFGAVFAGSKRFLQVAVRPGASTGAFTILTPRQELTPGPNAIFSTGAPWTGVIGKPAGFADDIDNDLLGGLSCAPGQVAKFNGAAWACAADAGTVFTTGAGLALTGTVLGIADGGVGTTQLADNAVTSAKVANGTILAGDIANGQVVRSLNGQADGVVVAGTNGLSVTAGTGTVTVTSNATPSAAVGAIVSRDAAGGFSAGTITASLAGNATTATSATTAASFTGTLAGEVTGAQAATVVSNAVPANTPNTIVRRDAAGNFSAGIITANLNGNAATATTATSATTAATATTATTFTGNLGGQVSGTQGNTVVTNAVSANTPSAIVRRDSAGGFLAGRVRADTLELPPTTSATSGVLVLGNVRFVHAFGSQNTFVGSGSGNLTDAGSFNTGVGQSTLAANSGARNSAFGYLALRSNTVGNNNSAFGASSLDSNTTGDDNDAFGSGALTQSAAGIQNAAFGSEALSLLTTGDQNAGFGRSALRNLASGTRNLALGANAGVGLTSGSDNIYIGAGAGGGSTESNTIRIGIPNLQTSTSIAGISGQTSASGVGVFVTVNGKLGTTTSSRRFKQDVVDMGEESDVLQRLRPVAFFYRLEYDDTHTRQYGLVAEEVAEVAPGLVVFDEEGQPATVRYHFVNAMLLNEVQKQAAHIRELERRLEALEARPSAR